MTVAFQIVGGTNSAPTVNAGADQNVTEGATVQLDASVSDADGDTVTIIWSQSSGAAVTLSSTSVEDPTFTAPDVDSSEDLMFQISASDSGATVTDTVTITVIDGTPVSTAEWIVNPGGETSNYITEGGNFVEVDVLSVTQAGSILRVETKSVPSYNVEVT